MSAAGGAVGIRASLRACAGRFRDRLRPRGVWDLRPRRSPARVRPPRDLTIVHPTGLTKAILWLFGRPWEGSGALGWPNGFPFPMPPCSSIAPSPSAGGASRRLRFSSWATRLWWSCGAQLSILSREIRWRLAGMRGRGRPGPNSPRCSGAPTIAGSASSCRVPSATPTARRPRSVLEFLGHPRAHQPTGPVGASNKNPARIPESIGLPAGAATPEAGK